MIDLAKIIDFNQNAVVDQDAFNILSKDLPLVIIMYTKLHIKESTKVTNAKIPSTVIFVSEKFLIVKPYPTHRQTVYGNTSVGISNNDSIQSPPFKKLTTDFLFTCNAYHFRKNNKRFFPIIIKSQNC